MSSPNLPPSILGVALQAPGAPRIPARVLADVQDQQGPGPEANPPALPGTQTIQEDPIPPTPPTPYLGPINSPLPSPVLPVQGPPQVSQEQAITPNLHVVG